MSANGVNSKYAPVGDEGYEASDAQDVSAEDWVAIEGRS